MKANKVLAGLLALSASPLASAATFEVTGATAFRRATIEAIEDLFDTSGVDFAFAHNRSTATDYINADFITFKGTITGLGPTVVRCSFNGSIEGLRALAQPGQSGIDGTDGDAWYIKESSVTATPTADGTNQIISGIDVGNPGANANLDRAEAEMAFSDTDVAISPYDPAIMVGGSPGGLVFSLVASEGAGFSNVTTQQYNSLLSNGRMPKSLFTGLSEDQGKLVFCTGRNDGSGTRSSYLAEMGYGVANPVQQYLVVGSSGNEITALQVVPAGGTNDSDGNPSNGVQLDPELDIANFDAVPGGSFNQVTQLFTSKSTVWGQDQEGNGGAFSGSVLRGHLALNGASVRVFDAEGFNLFDGVPQQNISMVSWISLNDAITARDGGATICSFNGVTLDVNPGKVLSAADRQKIVNGNYTAWNFQKFYYLDGADANTISLYTSIFNSVAGGNLGVAGIKNTEFKVGRPLDGGTINPL
jgi:hypothetical protein